MSNPKTPNTAPIDPSELWCVWGWLPYVDHDPTNPALRFQSWVLASDGDEGISEITGPRGHKPEDVIAAITLPQLREFLAFLRASSKDQSWIGKLLSPLASSGVSLVQDKHGNVEYKSTSDIIRSEHTVLLSGSIKDLEADVLRGDQIVAERDYYAIDGDVRPITAEHPNGWLWKQRDPDAFESIKDILDTSH